MFKNRRGNYVICAWAIINECWRNYSKQLANSIAVWKMDVLLKTRLACYSTRLQQKIQKLAHTGHDPLLFGVIKQSLFLQQQKKKITLMYLQNKMFGMLVWNPRRKRKLHCLSLGNYKSIFMQIYLKTDHLIIAYRKMNLLLTTTACLLFYETKTYKSHSSIDRLWCTFVEAIYKHTRM